MKSVYSLAESGSCWSDDMHSPTYLYLYFFYKAGTWFGLIYIYAWEILEKDILCSCG